MTDRQLLQQALDTLETADESSFWVNQESIVKALRERLAQPEQEPVAWVCYGAPGKRDIDFEEADINGLPIGTSLYATPPQRKPLTDEWIHRTTVLLGFNPEWTTEIGIAHAIVRAAEAAHGIKENT